MPQKRSACLQCQRHKVKCDASKPSCSRCSRLEKDCSYPAPIVKHHWPTATAALEARVLEAEMTIHKLTLSSTYDISLASKRLLEKIGDLGDLSRPRRPLYAAESVQLLTSLDSANGEAQREGRGVLLLQGVSAEEPESVQKVVAQELLLHDLTKLEELPLSLSIQLISLFFPYRSYYFFQMDGDQFMSRIILPPSHPNSIHPCLLNACYLAACASNEGCLTEFKPYFVHRTRYFLQQALTLADRTTHFLWGSLILSIFYVQEQRLVECVTVAATTARFALACGLNFPYESWKEDSASQRKEFLLPRPENKAEMDDRIRLAHSIYVGCQVLAFLCGSSPPFSHHDGWSQLWDTNFPGDQDGKVS
ncbi:hypothetical protein DL93DRAFT_1477792 [Clavulina sp. PMI_390]|nr:hypothetical protein DL93DRAFT_1477792 [Clavulina sp. PMI_390]